LKKLIIFIIILGLIAVRVQAQDNNQMLPLKSLQPGSVLDDIKAENISPLEASKMVAGQQAILLDVREYNEWEQQHIPEAIHIPYAQLSHRIAELAQYKDVNIIAQCRSGKRSQQAVKILKSAGFPKVFNLEGGLIAWSKDGFKTNK
jgi:rhodanese-related sulfurtransferase